MRKKTQATPYSVSAHMLYETANPYILYEPGGYLDVSKAKYKKINEAHRNYLKMLRKNDQNELKKLASTLENEFTKLMDKVDGIKAKNAVAAHERRHRSRFRKSYDAAKALVQAASNVLTYRRV